MLQHMHLEPSRYCSFRKLSPCSVLPGSMAHPSYPATSPVSAEIDPFVPATHQAMGEECISEYVVNILLRRACAEISHSIHALCLPVSSERGPLLVLFVSFFRDALLPRWRTRVEQSLRQRDIHNTEACFHIVPTEFIAWCGVSFQEPCILFLIWIWRHRTKCTAHLSRPRKELVHVLRSVEQLLLRNCRDVYTCPQIAARQRQGQAQQPKQPMWSALLAK